MKVCFVGLENLPVLAEEYNSHGIGGEQVQQTLLARGLSHRGYQVGMVTADYGQSDGKSWLGVQVFKSYRLDAGLPVIRYFYPRWTGLWSALGRANADVYYTSCAGMQVGLVALYCRVKGKGLVFRLASDADADPERVRIRYARDRKLYEYGLKQADRILSQHSRQQQMLKQNYAVDSAIADMLVEPPDRVLALDERNIQILWVNNFRDLKRPDLALELSRRLSEHHLHMLGGPLPGFSELYESIQQEVTTIPNISFHGRLPYHDVGDYYDQARVFVNTSDSEGFPNSFLQSWRRGVPVVTFFQPDDIITQKGLGYVVNSMDEMTKAVKKLLTDDAEWHACSERCRRYMKQYHSDDLVLKTYQDAIQYAYERKVSK
ncbi:MAG: glycosyltransferase family 4 protein [Candidatus Thiodiazotropha sp. (ex Lucinoma borealis)]|nr:glycosyltransferase family 4 protein [Candidatus Thiodiazotropha sp. (ex Lucinoma borealis)]MCU7867943.1 glycosyltransferase family 4 protein [Candidatus Thiodiazotropha sp. (ex Lucinoma borealis)]